MANVSKLHRPGRGRPARETFRDFVVEIHDKERNRIVHTLAVCKGYEPHDKYPEFRDATRWEFRDLNGNTVVMRRSSLPRTPETYD